MSQNLFAPKIAEPQEPSVAHVNIPNASDHTSATLLSGIRFALTAFAFLLPVFFLPGLWAGLGFQKVALAIGLLTVIAIGGSLLLLRTKQARSSIPAPVLFFAGLIGIAFVSAVFSADFAAALRGSVMETQTVSFMLVMFGVMLAPLFLQGSKKHTLYTGLSLGVGLSALVSFVVLRLFVGPVASMGSFASVTQSPAGNFNDIALVAATLLVVAVISLIQLPLKTVAQSVAAVAGVFSLVVLAAVNSLYIWLAVGFFGLLVLLYLLTHDVLFSGEDVQVSYKPQAVVIGLSVLICIVSAVFVVRGETAGTFVSNLFDVEYLEVRPSLGATADIARNVYSEDLLLGVGPNQFESAWREHKDISINQTLFWDTNFLAGGGFIPTLFVTLGLLGGLMAVAFTLSYLWFGVRGLLRPAKADSFWYFVGVSSFTGASFLWLMSYVYIPGATVLLLAAFLTGLSFVAMSDLQPASKKQIPLVINQKRGFALMAVSLFCITGSVFVLFTTAEQYTAQASFNKVDGPNATIAEIDQAAMSAYAMYPDDRFLGIRANLALFELNRLISIPDKTESQQTLTVEVAEQARAFAQLAVERGANNPQYHAAFAGVFNSYVLLSVPGAAPLATTTLAEAKRLDPKNPTYDLLGAQFAITRGDLAGARSEIAAALDKKRNFTQALLLLADLDIAEGDLDAAIVATQNVIRFEPRNQTRYLQLGRLFEANSQPEQALGAYEIALAIDPDFANARYLRALLLVQQDRVQEAIEQLQIVASTNVDNVQLQDLITELESGDLSSFEVNTELVEEASPNSDDGSVTSPVDPDTDLITPLNTRPAGETEDSTEEPQVEAAEELEEVQEPNEEPEALEEVEG